ncbi:MAG: AlpA family phage regulatory protein [Paracoccus denitrificans]|uniref:AlpA family phage regulatory protein n=1 Tax=Paracoccus denitrificans TaxID=266 RepID=A0A533IC05_PARDE|nr:MAG: AlpA family phage regulatory protein [Paracoccus denitrificans]
MGKFKPGFVRSRPAARKADFPQPVKLTPGCTRWKLSEIEAWEAAKAEQTAGKSLAGSRGAVFRSRAPVLLRGTGDRRTRQPVSQIGQVSGKSATG